MVKSPLQIVKERFNDKAGLITAVKALMTDELWVDRVNVNKGLESIPNQKLLHLHEVLSEVKTQYGSRAKLIDAIAAAEGKAKDADYKQGLGRHATPHLLEICRVAQKRAKRAAS